MNLLSFIAYILFVIISLEEDKKKKMILDLQI